MKKLLLLTLFAVIGYCNYGLSQSIILNGDFESWTSSGPDSWTTIDNGITVSEETTTTHGGSTSANVNVTTGSQSSTDFRQSVIVTSGTTYDFSVWIYNSDNTVKARIYCNGWKFYSNNNIVGNWQEISFEYTASTDGSIEVGLRFYDQSGFSGSSIVYIDDFTMTPQNSSPVAVTGVSLNKNTSTLITGGSETLIATISPTNATNQAVTWSSDNTSIATVDANGLVSAIAIGSANIIVTTDDGGFTASCNVNVTAPTDEPANHVSTLTATPNSSSQITLTWNNNDGTPAAEGYIVVGSTGSGSPISIADGVQPTNDNDWSDNNYSQQVDHSIETLLITGLTAETTYTFKIYPYTNSGTNINFKTDGSVPEASATTLAPPAINKLFISEVVDPDISSADNFRFVEIYNPTNQDIDLSNVYIQRQANGSSLGGKKLSGTIAANTSFVCAKNISAFTSEYGYAPNISASAISGNGDDAYLLREGSSTGNIIDIYGVLGQDGTGQAWEYTNAQAVRKNTVNQGSATWSADEWVITQNATTNIMTPGEHAENKIWTGDTDPDWSTKTNWTSINGRQFLPDPASKVSIASSSNQPNIATDICVHDLTTSDATAQLTIAAGNSLKVLNTLSTTNNNSLVLESNASSNAVLLHNTDGVAATVKIWHPNLLHIYYTGSPMTNTTANVFFGQYLYKWDEPSSAWVNIVEPTTALDPTRGYAVEKKNNTQAEYAGILNNGNINSVSITQQGSNADGKGWNLIANPYPSVIDMNEMNFDNANTGIEASVKVMKHLATGTTAVGSDYLTWSQGAGNPSGDNQARYIQPGQAFWVKATQTTAQTLIFTNAMRTKANIGVFDKGNDSPVAELRVSLLRHDTLVDRTYISFRKGATPGYDLNYDASIMNESLAPLYTLIGEKRMAINAIDNPLEVERIKTGVNVEAGSYTLYAEQMDSFDDEQDFYLFDRKTQKYINLRQQYVYTFDMAADDEPYRFDICFATNEGVENNLATTNNYYTYSQNNMLFIKAQNVTTETVAVSIYNTLGQLVYQNPHHKLSQAITLTSQQAYILSISDKTSASTHKVVIK